MELSFGLTRPVLASNTEVTVDVLLTFRADYAAARKAGRRPLAVSLVIDRSGSMSGAPLHTATRAAGLLVKQLSPDDHVAVVAYDHTVTTVVPMQRVVNAEAIAKQVANIRAGGSTNLHGGWVAGCEAARSVEGEAFVRRVLLLTDGQANVGTTDPATLVAEARAEAAKGVSTTTLGFGRDFHEDLLVGMADAGRGNFYFIETPDEATLVFLIEGESITSIAALDTSVTVRPHAGVKVVEVHDARIGAPSEDGALEVFLGDVYGGEDRHLALTLTVSPEALRGGVASLLDVAYRYTNGSDAKARGPVKGVVTVSAPVGDGDASPDPNLMRSVSRLRVARAKERAVQLHEGGDAKGAAEALRREAQDQRGRAMDEEFEIAEEVSQLEWFADTIERGTLDTAQRKMLRDQAFQGRARSRQDLSARGAGGGSAKHLPVATSVGNGVVLTCVREAGKLAVKIGSDGYDANLRVLLPRAVREEGVTYLVDGLEPSAHHTFYRVKGEIRRLDTKAVTVAAPGSSGLALDELFAGGGEPWLPLLKPVIEAQAKAAEFIGPKRDSSIVPVRELTFQALKPNPPEKWKVVVIGQNPYPRVESATGIAMFDNTFNHWKDSQFGKVTSIRCIIKAATMWKYGIPKATPIADIRALLAKKGTVQPPEWFQAMLTQGVLLMNAALTASADNARSDADGIAQHTAFWKPVIERILEEILKAKQAAPPEHRGVVFAWWGAHAKSLRGLVERMQKKYPAVPVKHIDHPNPAAQGDIFCDNDHFGAVNAALTSLKMGEVDWLPSTGWNRSAAGVSATASASTKGEAAAQAEESERMGDFIQKTMELHRFYLERLQEVKDEVGAVLGPITGVRALPVRPFGDAVSDSVVAVKGLDYYIKQAQAFAKRKTAGGALAHLDEHEVAALWLYTCESGFYRTINAVLRDPDRAKVAPFTAYLRLLIGALDKMKRTTDTLWRGVAVDLRKQYPVGSTITWWGVSSCTAKLSVAHSFLGSKGKRTLFEVHPLRAVGIREFSAFSGEEEFLLAPGTQLKVSEVVAEKGGLCTVRLDELDVDRAVS